MKAGRLPYRSVGVDLVEYAKAFDLWRSGGEKLQRILSASEWGALRKSHQPERDLASILASKEAVFKTLDRHWMGPDGFRSIRVPKKRVSLKHTKRYVVATCVGI